MSDSPLLSCEIEVEFDPELILDFFILLKASRFDTSAEIIAKGAQSVRAHETPTIPIRAVAAAMERTMSVLNMQVAKMR